MTSPTKLIVMLVGAGEDAGAWMQPRKSQPRMPYLTLPPPLLHLHLLHLSQEMRKMHLLPLIRSSTAAQDQHGDSKKNKGGNRP